MLSPVQLWKWKQDKSSPLPDENLSSIWWQLSSPVSLSPPFSRLGLSGQAMSESLFSARTVLSIPSCRPWFSSHRFFASTFYYQHFEALNKFKNLYNELPCTHLLDSITNILLSWFITYFFFYPPSVHSSV